MSGAGAVATFTGCDVIATMDGAGGFVVRVVRQGESLLAVHVPSPEARAAGAVSYWNSTEWGGLLLRTLYAADSKQGGRGAVTIPKKSARAPVAAARKWKG